MSFTLIVAHNLQTSLLDQLSGLLWSNASFPHLVVVRSAGFLAEFFIQFHEHTSEVSTLSSQKFSLFYTVPSCRKSFRDFAIPAYRQAVPCATPTCIIARLRQYGFNRTCPHSLRRHPCPRHRSLEGIRECLCHTVPLQVRDFVLSTTISPRNHMPKRTSSSNTLQR